MKIRYIMNKILKKALYESIMKNVSKLVKKALNEAVQGAASVSDSVLPLEVVDEIREEIKDGMYNAVYKYCEEMGQMEDEYVTRTGRRHGDNKRFEINARRLKKARLKGFADYDDNDYYIDIHMQQIPQKFTFKVYDNNDKRVSTIEEELKSIFDNEHLWDEVIDEYIEEFDYAKESHARLHGSYDEL